MENKQSKDATERTGAAGMRPLRFGGIRWKDDVFWLILTLGPITWTVMLFILTPTDNWTWPLQNPWVFLLPVLIYPVLEEIVFRGLIQDWIAGKTSKAFGILTLANLITSVLFAASHLIYQTPLWAALIFFPSLIFGWFRERHDTLGSPILIHVWYNFGMVWFFGG